MTIYIAADLRNLPTLIGDKVWVGPQALKSALISLLRNPEVTMDKLSTELKKIEEKPNKERDSI